MKILKILESILKWCNKNSKSLFIAILRSADRYGNKILSKSSGKQLQFNKYKIVYWQYSVI